MKPTILAALVSAAQAEEEEERMRNTAVFMSGAQEESDPIGDALRADAIAYWKKDETSGTRVDATGNGNDITVFGDSVPSATGKVSNGANLTPSNGVLQNTDFTVFNMGSRNFSFWGWVKFNSLTAGEILFKGDIDDSAEWRLRLDGSFKLAFTCVGDGYEEVNIQADTFGVVSADVFVFVVVHVDLDADLIGIQVNNGNIDTAAFTPNTLNGNTPFAFGGSWSSFGGDYGQKIDAVTDEFGMLYRTLASDERAYLYNSGAGRTLFP